MNRMWMKMFLVGASAVMISAGVHAETWPSKPVRLVVPFPPGGATDATARIYAQHLGALLKQPVVIDNRAGAGGEIGSEFVAKAAPDGYTLLMGALASQAVHAALPERPAYNFTTAYSGVSLATTTPMAVAVSTKLPANSIRELVDLARKQPGKLSFGSAGPGSAQQMAGEFFQAKAGVKLLHVPYRGSGPAIADLLGGQVDLVFDTLPALLPQIASGKIRLIGLTSEKRLPTLPDLATVEEQGVTGYRVTNTYALLAPAGTPKEIVKTLSGAMQTVAAMPAVQDSVRKLGGEVAFTTPEETDRLIKAEAVKWAGVVRMSLEQAATASR
ncbi:tripartite tricarboxylate transporter substrate binding protein [Cupriavidus sp. 2SB]|uniref:Bug family tripartite tricarboxylate transporter substrate binding protein n=1 Tax=Cupriavidus sp. 2SB TaxID=2502199 RepID=UPI0010F7FF26|nr:tripartite tricarboxylate transporter substrate binding protein [Cupriavidus sp. 2SB]